MTSLSDITQLPVVLVSQVNITHVQDVTAIKHEMKLSVSDK